MFELFKMLWSGRNAQAPGPFDDTERARVRAALNPGELPVALLRGRVKKAGPAFWALTDQRLLVFECYGRQATTVVTLQAPMQLHLLPGHYGVTVALYQGGRRHGLYATDRGLAQALADALQQRVPALELDQALKQPATASELAQAAQALAISRASLRTGLPQPNAAAAAPPRSTAVPA